MQHATRPSQGSASRKVQRNHVRVVPQRTPRCKKQSKKKVSSIHPSIHPSIYDQLCMQNHTMHRYIACLLAVYVTRGDPVLLAPAPLRPPKGHYSRTERSRGDVPPETTGDKEGKTRQK